MTNTIPTPAKVLVGAMTAGACGLVITGSTRWHSHDMLPFLSLLAATVLTSRMKVKLPKLTSTMSVNLPFILLAAMQLSLLETALIGLAAGIAQCFGKSSRPQPVHLVFNGATLVSAASLAYLAFHANSDHSFFGSATWMAVTAVVYFVANTVPVAAIIACTEQQKMARVWYDFFLWTLPNYVLGTGLAFMAASVNPWVSWKVAAPVLLVAWGAHRSYRVYTAHADHSETRAMSAVAGK